MNDTDRIYRLFTEADPAPESVVSTIERPTADVFLLDLERTPMLTREPKIQVADQAAPRTRRLRGPAVALTSFAAAAIVGAAVVGVAAWLSSGDGQTVATQPTLPPVTTQAPTTTVAPTPVPTLVTVPDFDGMTLAEARSLAATLGLELEAIPEAVDEAIVVAQDPAPGTQVDEGTMLAVDARVTPTCTPTVPADPGPNQAEIFLLFECGADGLYPTVGIPLHRLVPRGGGEAIDRIEWTLRSLLSGLSPEEKAAGFTSFFGFTTTGDTLNSVTLTDGHVVADFDETIYVNNASTSTGGLFFNAELRANLFQHTEVDSVEFRVNGDCEAWSAFFQSDGCWIITRADWEQQLAEWDELRAQ